MRKFFLGLVVILALSIGLFGFIDNRSSNSFLVEDPVDAGPQSPPLPPIEVTV